MQLIKASSSIMEYDANPLKHIELVARNCYKSEEKITEDSCNEFVRKLKDRKHMAMLEFYPFYFHVSSFVANDLLYINNHPTIDGDLMLHDNPHNVYTDVSCNLRTAIMISKYDGKLANAIISKYPHLAFLFDEISDNNTTVLVDENDVDFPMHLRYRTGRFICDRGVTHELVRHRKCSFAQESTRYCNYGKTNMQFIIPSWCNDDHISDNPSHSYLVWLDAIQDAEENYNIMLNDGWIPQQARSVLPNSLKTEIIIQARLSEWKHIFEQRCAKAAHPDMQYLMIPFREKLLGSNVDVNLYLIE